MLRVLKDFGEKNGERKIFDYFAAGWNRDGLALRMAAELLNTAPADKHLLILLTDASPADSHKILPTGKVPLSRDYDGQVGVEDTADEVRALRRKGIRVGSGSHSPDGSALRRGGTADPNGDPGAVRLNKQTTTPYLPVWRGCFIPLFQYATLLHGHHGDAVFPLAVNA